MGPWSKTDWDLNQQNATKREPCVYFLGCTLYGALSTSSGVSSPKNLKKTPHTSSGRVRVMYGCLLWVHIVKNDLAFLPFVLCWLSCHHSLRHIETLLVLVSISWFAIHYGEQQLPQHTHRHFPLKRNRIKYIVCHIIFLLDLWIFITCLAETWESISRNYCMETKLNHQLFIWRFAL